MTKLTLSFIAAATLGAGLVFAEPTSQPAAGISAAPSAIEVRGLEEFNRGMYAMALPMLQKAADQVKDQPDRLSTIQEDIRVCQRNIAQAQGAQAVQTSDSSPGSPASPAAATAAGATPSVARTPHPKPTAGVVQDMEIKDLGNFDYDADKGGNIPADVMAMDGSLIKLRGFMVPMDQAEAITQFALVPSLFSCCFGQPPQIQHTIIIHVPKGKAVSYYPDEISVEGTLHVRERKEDGFIVSIFDIDTTSVKPAPK